MNKTIAVALLSFSALSGCSTPAPVREFAARGAALTDQADRETRAFLARAERARLTRLEVIRTMAERDIDIDTKHQFNEWVAEQAGITRAREQIDLVHGLAEQSRKTREEADARVAEVRQKLDAAPPVSSDEATKALATTKKSFVILAQELSPQEWATFGWKYFKQVRDAYKADGQPEED